MWNKLYRDLGLSLVAALVAITITMIGPLRAAQSSMMNKGINPPTVSARSVFVMNATTGDVLYEKNPDEVFRTLSLTKLVTAYILVDRMGDRLFETIEISAPHLTGGSSASLKRRDVWTLQDLLYGMVLVSGNDASLAIADAVGQDLLADEGKTGDTAKATRRFVTEMEIAAHDLGARNASFADPYGLSAKNAATARDMGLIAARIFTDPRLLPAWACTERTLNIQGKRPRAVALKTSLEILGDEPVIGAKTGSYVSKGIFNLVTAWRAPNGQTIVGVVLGAKSDAARYAEMRGFIEAAPKDFEQLRGPAVAAEPPPTSGCN
ncbi:MAG: serine hydrolase [Methyloceanibacter sp.]|jgi:D-alanyl-D-alanine carboxypeptidase